jgi:dinuclear metal center YbgI/SA1388 family protein
MIVKDVMEWLEELAPSQYAEDFDNVGLLVGNPETEVTNIIVSLDTLEAVVDEAIAKNCNLIVSFHPIIFSGLKKLNGNSYVERTVIKAIEHKIGIYAIHTSLDNHWKGVSDILCKALNLNKRQILLPKQQTIHKLTTFVPIKNAETVREALFAAGAGNIGNYSNCSFNLQGLGSFKGNENSNPTVGKKGETHFEEETQITVTYQKHLEAGILQNLFKSHPYEEVAYEIITLNNLNQHIGLGMVGELGEPMKTTDFLNQIKLTLNIPVIKHSHLCKTQIRRVAVLGGSGSFAIEAAKRAKVDLFLTADLKYHDYFKSENEIIIADIGHYESEQFTKNYLVDFLSKKITNFAPALTQSKVWISTTNTNPVKYF